MRPPGRHRRRRAGRRTTAAFLLRHQAAYLADPAVRRVRDLPCSPPQTVNYKIADIRIPAGQHVLRIHASQQLSPGDGDPRRYKFTMYAPQLSLAPASNVRLGATVIFPLDCTAAVDALLVESMPCQPAVSLIGGGDTPVQVGLQRAYGWAFQADPKITMSYVYA